MWGNGEGVVSKSKYLEAALAWDAAGRPTGQLCSDDYPLTALHCWVGRKPADEPPDLALIRAYAEASIAWREQNDPGWYDAFLGTRSYCERCGERYRVENLAICTGCLREICHACIDEPMSGWGRYVHHCGGELVG